MNFFKLDFKKTYSWWGAKLFRFARCPVCNNKTYKNNLSELPNGRCYKCNLHWGFGARVAHNQEEWIEITGWVPYIILQVLDCQVYIASDCCSISPLPKYCARIPQGYKEIFDQITKPTHPSEIPIFVETFKKYLIVT